jgi:hypothetical protein
MFDDDSKGWRLKRDRMFSFIDIKKKTLSETLSSNVPFAISYERFASNDRSLIFLWWCQRTSVQALLQTDVNLHPRNDRWKNEYGMAVNCFSQWKTEVISENTLPVSVIDIYNRSHTEYSDTEPGFPQCKAEQPPCATAQLCLKCYFHQNFFLLPGFQWWLVKHERTSKA